MVHPHLEVVGERALVQVYQPPGQELGRLRPEHLELGELAEIVDPPGQQECGIVQVVVRVVVGENRWSICPGDSPILTILWVAAGPQSNMRYSSPDLSTTDVPNASGVATGPPDPTMHRVSTPVLLYTQNGPCAREAISSLSSS